MKRSALGAIFLLCWAAGAAAQDLTAAAQTPAPVNTFEFDAGYAFGISKDVEDDTFYRVVLSGKQLQEKGTPVKFAEHLDLTEPAMTAAGDRPQLALRLIGGAATLGGTLIEADGAKALTLRGLERLRLRGTALVTGQTSGGPIQVAAGLETRPFRIPGLSAKQYTNWIVFGLNGQHREETDTNNDENFGLATYRAFAGKAFGWRKSADVGKTAKQIEKQMLENAPTLADAQRVEKEIKTKNPDATKRSKMQQFFLDAVGESENDADWRKTVHAMAVGRADAITDQQTVSVYAEATGWYAFDGADEGELKSLFSAVLDYWPFSDRDNVLLRLRYENGYQRAAPDDYLNQVLLSATVRF
jgi:hypothetical protein